MQNILCTSYVRNSRMTEVVLKTIIDSQELAALEKVSILVRHVFGIDLGSQSISSLMPSFGARCLFWFASVSPGTGNTVASLSAIL